jgi:hypothetical protein
MIRLFEWVTVLTTIVLSLVIIGGPLKLWQAGALIIGCLSLGTLFFYVLDRWIKGWRENRWRHQPGQCYGCGLAVEPGDALEVNGYGFCSWECVPREWIG